MMKHGKYPRNGFEGETHVNSQLHLWGRNSGERQHSRHLWSSVDTTYYTRSRLREWLLKSMFVYHVPIGLSFHLGRLYKKVPQRDISNSTPRFQFPRCSTMVKRLSVSCRSVTIVLPSISIGTKELRQTIRSMIACSLRSYFGWYYRTGTIEFQRGFLYP